MSSIPAPPLDGLPGLDPSWSRRVRVTDSASGDSHDWHLLDTAGELERLGVTPVGTILAVHGNPTWSYLWRRIVGASVEAAATGAPAWRVVAVDHLNMGFSARTGSPRSLQQRVSDLGDLTEERGEQVVDDHLPVELDDEVVDVGSGDQVAGRGDGRGNGGLRHRRPCR